MTVQELEKLEEVIERHLDAVKGVTFHREGCRKNVQINVDVGAFMAAYAEARINGDPPPPSPWSKWMAECPCPKCTGGRP